MMKSSRIIKAIFTGLSCAFLLNQFYYKRFFAGFVIGAAAYLLSELVYALIFGADD